ncbi:hypothetical protein [Bacillus pseudomycoides]|uniref:hypothetical protein n=1 Tax=Bacillus pseudomycoides TaxID=64104 RepID=UPI00050095E5|nr:hypothetical protein [Bacillus pseudomycoides]KFN10983.1 hypothetical protein DJ94_5434 [Bacillus pseudomycoides]MDR4188053.1 hypothetical protein [Bacillus pseudomycoides]MED0855670.1 hypothetical protein [Bacillus pseudomycoides]PEI44632.1 hypothetical protein CN641_16045 [Bacillus pseudomycoides]PEN08556.1 hypothetical protein CN640_13005 [Bacillus pseudomycoides]
MILSKYILRYIVTGKNRFYKHTFSVISLSETEALQKGENELKRRLGENYYKDLRIQNVVPLNNISQNANAVSRTS